MYCIWDVNLNLTCSSKGAGQKPIDKARDNVMDK